jgi:hypothetical protein
VKTTATTALVAALFSLAFGTSARAQSLIGTWDGSWNFFPSCTGCVANDSENLIITGVTPTGSGTSVVTGNFFECVPAGSTSCKSFTWSTGTLSGNQLSLDSPGYDMVATISGNTMSGEWIPEPGATFPSYVVLGSCTANEANGYCNTYRAVRAPEPGTLGLMAFAFTGAALLRHRRRR